MLLLRYVVRRHDRNTSYDVLLVPAHPLHWPCASLRAVCGVLDGLCRFSIFPFALWA